MIEEMKARDAPFTGSPKDYEFTTKTAAINVKEPLAVSHESDRPVADVVAPVVTVAERVPFPFEMDVADESSSLIPDAETIARYEAEAHEQRIAEGKKELGRRMYDGIKRGFAKIGDALRGLDAKVASAIPSVSPMPVYETPTMPVVAEVRESNPMATPSVSSRRECGIITVAREYGLLKEKEAPTSDSLVASPQRIFTLGAGDSLGTALYLQAQFRKMENKSQSLESEPVRVSSEISPAVLTPTRSSEHYTSQTWQHEPSRMKVVGIPSRNEYSRFNPTLVFMEVGNSGTLAPQTDFTQEQLKQMWTSGQKFIEGRGIIRMELDGSYSIVTSDDYAAQNKRMLQRMREAEEVARQKILSNVKGN
jgi:hypothetical protein